MSYEIDHIFICTSTGAPEADRLVELGLTEGSSNTHAGQGTANRRFFFRNAMLELLYVTDPNEAQSAATRPTRLWDRWAGRNQDCSPFGVCLRPATMESIRPPFLSWEYHPAYMPENIVIHVGQDSPLTEPMWFFLAPRPWTEEGATGQREPTDHAADIVSLTGVRIVSPPSGDLSLTAKSAIQATPVVMSSGPRHSLELTFDGNRQANEQDFRPELPLTMKW